MTEKEASSILAKKVTGLLPRPQIWSRVRTLGTVGPTFLLDLETISGDRGQRLLQTTPGKSKLIASATKELGGEELVLGVNPVRREGVFALLWRTSERPVLAEKYGFVFDEGPCSALAICFKLKAISG